MISNIICPKCKNKEVKKDGVRKTNNRGKIQRYKCKKCSFRFVQDNGFKRMRNHEKKITLCLDLFFRGMSTRKIQEHLKVFYLHNSDHSTILRWIQKYSVMIHNYTNNLKINSGCELQIDEMEYKIKGKRGWFIDCIDSKTRYMVSSEMFNARDSVEIRKILQIAKNKTEKQVSIITTDGWLGYPKAIQKTFMLKNKTNTKRDGVIHNQVNASQGEGFNHKIERLHNNIRERTKVFRGFKRLESAKAIMKGYEVFYNFMRVNQAISKTPSELAIPELKLKSANKWIELIRLSKN